MHRLGHGTPPRWLAAIQPSWSLTRTRGPIASDQLRNLPTRTSRGKRAYAFADFEGSIPLLQRVFQRSHGRPSMRRQRYWWTHRGIGAQGGKKHLLALGLL